MKADPILFLKKGTSIFALAGNNKWANENSHMPKIERQDSNGSWNNSVNKTIQNLYQLTLFFKKPDKNIIKAIEWLMETELPPFRMKSDVVTYDNLFFKTYGHDRKMMRKLNSMPFTPGCSGFVKSGAALYFAVHFGMENSNRANLAFEKVLEISEKRNGRFCSGSCGNNMVQALAVHPELNKSKAMRIACEFLYKNQMKSGKWQIGIPFYPTFSALSRVNIDIANTMFEKAWINLQENQNNDGSWGRSDKDFKTYMVIDALKRKGIWDN